MNLERRTLLTCVLGTFLATANQTETAFRLGQDIAWCPQGWGPRGVGAKTQKKWGAEGWTPEKPKRALWVVHGRRPRPQFNEKTPQEGKKRAQFWAVRRRGVQRRGVLRRGSCGGSRRTHTRTHNTTHSHNTPTTHPHNTHNAHT